MMLRHCVTVALAVHQLVAYAINLIMNQIAISPDALNRFRHAASKLRAVLRRVLHGG